MVKIRLAMHGRIHAPTYRIVAVPTRSKRDGAPLEILGHYNPIENKLDIKKKALEAWVAKGAQISDGVKKLLK